MSDYIIRLQGVDYEYPRADQPPQRALTDVTLDICQGEFVAVIGHNGSGKSTLARLLNALLLPTDGRILIDGLDTRDSAQLWQIRQRVGVVFQNPDNQIVATQVQEDVAFGPENMGVEPKEIRLRVREALEAVRMWDKRDMQPHRLSGGQKQRVAIAGILAMRPRILVLDEATAMLDPQGRAEVLETVHRLNRTEGITVIMITHFMEEAVPADRVVVLDDGRVAMDLTPREAFARQDQLHAIGLSVPRMAVLAALLMEKGVAFARMPITVEEMLESLCPLL